MGRVICQLNWLCLLVLAASACPAAALGRRSKKNLGEHLGLYRGGDSAQRVLPPEALAVPANPEPSLTIGANLPAARQLSYTPATAVGNSRASMVGMLRGQLCEASAMASAAVRNLLVGFLDSGLHLLGMNGTGGEGMNGTGGGDPPRQRTGIRGWLLDREEGQPAFFMVHVPKTAGTSFTLDIASGKVLPAGVGFFSQEWCFHSAWDALFSMDKFVTFLRNPKDHVYSMYFECAYTKWGHNNFHPPDGQMSNFSSWLRHFSANNSNRTGRGDAYGCYDPRNMQTRAFTCRGREEAVHQGGRDGGRVAATTVASSQMSRVDLALQRMEDSFFFVGIAEHYQVSWCLFYAKVNGHMPAECDCKNVNAWQQFGKTLRHVDFSVPQHNASADLEPKDLEIIDELTADDRQLYKTAMQRFEVEAMNAEETHGVKLLC